MKNLRRLRQKAGLTMKELSKAVKISESAVSQYELGKRQPDYETLLKLAEFFGVSADYLIRDEDTAKPFRKASNEELMFALWGDAEEMTQEDLDDVRAYAQFLRERKKNNG